MSCSEAPIPCGARISRLFYPRKLGKTRMADEFVPHSSNGLSRKWVGIWVRADSGSSRNGTLNQRREFFLLCMIPSGTPFCLSSPRTSSDSSTCHCTILFTDPCCRTTLQHHMMIINPKTPCKHFRPCHSYFFPTIIAGTNSPQTAITVDTIFPDDFQNSGRQSISR